MLDMSSDPSQDLRLHLSGDRFGCVLVAPLSCVTNRTGNIAAKGAWGMPIVSSPGGSGKAADSLGGHTLNPVKATQRR